MEQERFYTINQVTELLGVHRTTVYDWMNAGRLAYVQVGERRRIPKSALDAFIKEGKPAQAPEVEQPVNKRMPALIAA